MKMLLVDVYNNEIKVVDPEGLDDYYKLIGCSTVDIPVRIIGGRMFNLICDDEGMLKSNPVISAVNGKYEPMLVGNLLIASGSIVGDGDLAPITDEEIKHIKKNIITAKNNSDNRIYKLISNVEYF